MFKQSLKISVILPEAHFIRLLEEARPGVIECYCVFCNHLIAASRDKRVLEIVRQNHTCKSDTADLKKPGFSIA